MPIWDALEDFAVVVEEDLAVLYDLLFHVKLPDFCQFIGAKYNIALEKFDKIQRPFDITIRVAAVLFFLWPLILVTTALFCNPFVTGMIAYLALPLLILVPFFFLKRMLEKIAIVIGFGTLLNILGEFSGKAADLSDRIEDGVAKTAKTVSRALGNLYFANLVFGFILMLLPLENNQNLAWTLLIGVECGFLALLYKYHVFAKYIWRTVLVVAIIIFLGGTFSNIVVNLKWGVKEAKSIVGYTPSTSNTVSKQQPVAQQKEPFQGPNPANQRVIELPSASSGGGSRSIPLGSDLEEGPANATLSYGGAEIVQNVRTYNLTIPPLPSEKKEEKTTINTQPSPSSVDDPSQWTQWVSHSDRYGYDWSYPGKNSDVLLYVQFKYSTGRYSDAFLDGSGKVLRLDTSITAVRFSNPSSNPPVVVVCKLVDH